jgi:hypothetical protein
MSMQDHVAGLLAKTRWRQELNKRGYEGRAPMASERLTETLRAELRTILDNDGKPFDIQCARHLYDFAIVAKDMLTVTAKTVEDAMRVVADNNGAMESLTGPDDPVPTEVASETFGARILRELLATMPGILRKTEDPALLVAAIADARERGMPDLAAKLEQKLMGTPLEPAKITRAEVVEDSYEHGFVEGSMQDNFENGIVDGCSGRILAGTSPAYREGFEAGRARRQQLKTLGEGQAPVLTQPRWAQPGLSSSEIRDEIIAEVGMMADARTPEMQAAYDAALAREGKVDSATGPTTSPSVRGVDICAGCGNRECFNVCCHPSNQLRAPSNGQHSLPSGDAP